LGEAASLIESLKKRGPFDHRCTKGKNLTHLQSILLFKDSSGVAIKMGRRQGAG